MPWLSSSLPFLALLIILVTSTFAQLGRRDLNLNSTPWPNLRPLASGNHSSRPPTKGCFTNKSVIASKVFSSSIVFAAKILNLTETVVKRVVVTKIKPAPPSTLAYYHYDYNQRKRRREISTVTNVTLGVGRALIKTVFKGDENLEGKVVSVTIEGGDGSKESRGMARCLRKLREGDTRLFFYSGVNLVVSGGGWRTWTMVNQTSVPLPPALSVLATVRNAVKGK